MHTNVLIFIQDLAIVMLMAGLSNLLCSLFKQPIILGYIIAGVIIGPYTPPFSLVTDLSTIKTLAELGVIFIMFSLGLEFNLHKLSRVGGAALVAAFLEIALMIALGYALGRWFGWQQMDALFLGCLLSISSTIIIIKSLSELKMGQEKFAQLIFGILIVEDMFAILILALLSGVALTGSLTLPDVVITVIKLSSFLVFSIVIGILLVPQFLRYIIRLKNNEMLLISVLALCFGFCLLVAKLNYSVALGAFIMGAIVAESQQLSKIEHLIHPITNMFSAIFFVSVGLLFDPKTFLQYLIPILVITAAVIIGKVVSCSLGLLMAGHDGKTATRAGMGLAQIGEFSFIIASLGITLNGSGSYLYTIAVGVSIITALLTPYLIKSSDLVSTQLGCLVPYRVERLFTRYRAWLHPPPITKSRLKSIRIIKRKLIHIIINMVMIFSIFLCAAYLTGTPLGYLLARVTSSYCQKSLIWGLAIVTSLPFSVAFFHEVKILSLLLLMRVIKSPLESNYSVIGKKIISEVVPMAALAGIVIFASLLSSRALPPLPLLMLVLIITRIIMALFLPGLLKLYAQFKKKFLSSLNQNP